MPLENVSSPTAYLSQLRTTPLGRLVLTALAVAAASAVALSFFESPTTGVFAITGILAFAVVILLLERLREFSGQLGFSRKLVAPLMVIVWAITIAFVVSLVIGLVLLVVHSFSNQETAQTRRVGDLSVAQFTHLIAPGGSEAASELRLGIEADLLRLTARPMPITGDEASTARTTLARFDHAFLQAEHFFLKLQRMTLPPGALRLRGRSNQKREGAGPFQATTWLFRHSRGELQPIGRRDAGLNTPEAYWPLGNLPVGSEIFLIAYYPNAGLFTGARPRDFAGLELEDLSGTVEEVFMIIGGRFASLAIDDVFTVVPGKEPFLRPLPTYKLTLMENPDNFLKSRFAPVLKKLSESTEEPYRTIHRGVCDALQANSTWQGIKLTKVSGDIALTLRGAR